MDIYSIYKVTNLSSGKVYIGFTSKNPAKRWTQHKTIARNPNNPHHKYLHRAMRKHGIENFAFDVIYQSLDEDHTLNTMESYFIDQYDALTNGYNVTVGGIAPMLGRKHSAETLERFKTRSASRAHNWIVVYPSGVEEHITNLNAFCKANGLHQGNMAKVAAGKITHSKGYVCRKM